MRNALFLVFALISPPLIGCDSGPPMPPITVDLGVPADLSNPPRDFSFPTGDVYVPPDQRVHDAGPDKGADGGCHQPKPTCKKTCAPKELCTEASGGTCATTTVLSGKADSKAVFRAIALAYLECWKKAPSQDTLCSTFDTCALEGSVSEASIKEWICKKAQVVDFKDKPTYDDVRSVGGCEIWQTYRPRFMSPVASIDKSERAETCLGYDKNPLWQFDRVAVHACKSFPYP